MGIEIERKFLVNKSKWGPSEKGAYIKQIYLLNLPDKTIRLRIKGKQAFLTIKTGNTGITRKEFEYEIPHNDAFEIINEFNSLESIEKTRFLIEYMGSQWEVDVFHGQNEGLILAEIELKSESETFSKPDWLGTEVSLDPKYYNANLIKNPYKNWITD